MTMQKPERIVHLGLGAFFKAHQAWYTQHAADAENWGIVAYTGRSPAAAEALTGQACRYTVVTRAEAEDSFEVVDSVVRAESGTNLDDLKATLAREQIALVTLTITEAGYQLTESALADSTLGRLCIALDARRQAGGWPIALVSCDNLPGNGNVLAAALRQLGTELGPEFLAYLESSVSFVNTSIDRITPKTEVEDYELVSTATGFGDAAAVVAEPFSDWVLEGEFPLGRPDWESAGARFVADVTPFEKRKLWLLNGAHSLLAYSGLTQQFETVDEAVTDPGIKASMLQFWREAAAQLTAETTAEIDLALDSYQRALLERFENPRIAHRLSQIAQQGLTKMSVRIVPILLAALQAKGDQTNPASGCESALLAWLNWVLATDLIVDGRFEEITAAKHSSDPVRALLQLLSPAFQEFPIFTSALVGRAMALR